MLLTLLSDFGSNDGYVAIMKGVVAQINPHLRIIDLTHQIPPQDIAAGRFQLLSAYPYFPPGTVHVAVVDPGVGSDRRAIALQLDQYWLVGPDNGLLSGVFNQHPILAAIELTNPQYWRCPDPSVTFQGRDIFAPVGAHLASGVPIAEIGAAIDPASLIDWPLPALTVITEGAVEQIQGCVQAIDHFGNLITNIPGHVVRGKSWSVQVRQTKYPGKTTYADGKPGQIIALIGSHGWVEIAANQDHAALQLGIKCGAPVCLSSPYPSLEEFA
jgi:S-adenosyl-L-methionine hydrolase (adenosine-forming)